MSGSERKGKEGCFDSLGKQLLAEEDVREKKKRRYKEK